jgi:hypothetical protein
MEALYIIAVASAVSSVFGAWELRKIKNALVSPPDERNFWKIDWKAVKLGIHDKLTGVSPERNNMPALADEEVRFAMVDGKRYWIDYQGVGHLIKKEIRDDQIKKPGELFGFGGDFGGTFGVGVEKQEAKGPADEVCGKETPSSKTPTQRLNERLDNAERPTWDPLFKAKDHPSNDLLY